MTSKEISTEEEFRQRHIRSFVHRRGHISKAQETALEELMPVWGISYQAQSKLNFSEAFNNAEGEAKQNWLEIGCGMGETTAKIALANPSVNYLGIEIYKAGVGALLKRIEEEQIKNIRLISHDAVEVLRDMVPNESLDRVLIYFPDPWRKARHHKRRLIQPEFVSHLCTKLKTGGILHCATDWENYAFHMLEVLSGEPALANTADGFAPRPETRPLTKFENRGLKLGHGVWDLVFKKS